MTSVGQLREAAMSLLEAVEEEAPDRVISFAVAGRTFASANTADADVSLHLGPEDAAELVSSQPATQRLTDRGMLVGVRVPLADVDGQQLNYWVRRAWFANAPQRLVAQATAAESAAPGDVGDLPKGIGRPATRALAEAGITSLAHVAELTEAELRAMHGVGPKAIRLLDEALAATGRSLQG